MKKMIRFWGIVLGSLSVTAVAAAEEAGGFLKGVENVNNAVNGVVWGVPALVLLAFVGVLMTVLTKVFQVTHFGHWMKRFGRASGGVSGVGASAGLISSAAAACSSSLAS